MRKSISLIICLVLVSVLVGNLIYNNIQYEKISFDNNDSARELINHSLENNDSNNNGVIVEQVIVQLKLAYNDFKASELCYNYTSNEIDRAKEKQHQLRCEGYNYHKLRNEKEFKLLDKLGSYKDVYIASYSPFIELYYDKTYFENNKYQLLSFLSNIDIVESIRVIDSFEYIDNIYGQLCASWAGTVYNNRTVTGDGISIGMLEMGIPDTDNEYLVNTDITIKFDILNPIKKTDHATTVALIMAGENGVAPDASIYSCFVSGTITNEVEWLVNQGVDVINMSFGERNPTGYYNDESCFVDYIVYTYNVPVVAAVGNFGEEGGLVANPALGYNVISVGAMDFDGCAEDYSSHETYEELCKPTVCVTGASIYVDGSDPDTVTGTSFTCALCTGMIALLLEAQPCLMGDVDRLIALIVANAEYFNLSGSVEDNGFDYYTGAGRFNYQNIIDNISNSMTIYSSFTEVDDIVYETSIYVQYQQTLSVSIAVLLRTNGTISNNRFSDYDIIFLSPRDRVITVVNAWSTTIELLTHVAEYSGNYKVRIILGGNVYFPPNSSVDQLALAYRIH